MDFLSLSSDRFENLTFDLLQAAGLKNLVWRTPGADGGRDIEGVFSSVDFSKRHRTEKWYVECKRYSNSIDWPTVWNKISYAESTGADFLLLVTNNNPSPKCETEIENWNNSKKPVLVRIWRGYELEGILRNYPQIASKYGLLGKSREAELGLQSLMFESMKLAQSAYVSQEFGELDQSALEANAALSELISLRYSQIRSHGRIGPAIGGAAPTYSWLTWQGPVDGWDEIGVRAAVTMARHLTGSTSVDAVSSAGTLTLTLQNPRFQITGTTSTAWAELLTWADIEIRQVSPRLLTVAQRS